MDPTNVLPLQIGAWRVDLVSGQISRGDEIVRLEMRTMRLLACLAQRAGEVVSIDELLDSAWAGVIVTPDSVYQAVATLRRSLGDDPRQPAYIATVPRLGYRMVAKVSACVEPDHALALPRHSDVITAPVDVLPKADIRNGAGVMLAVAAVLVLAIGMFYSRVHPIAGTASQEASVAAHAMEGSIGVLPFLDLTEEMDEEPFADGMTEELISKLSKIPGVRVPAFTSSLNFKGKEATIADVARTLGVAYVLEGSVRKSGTTLRVTAQLIRADSGYLVWSETYDRTMADILKIQDDIAAEVKHALEASLKNPSSTGPISARNVARLP